MNALTNLKRNSLISTFLSLLLLTSLSGCQEKLEVPEAEKATTGSLTITVAEARRWANSHLKREDAGRINWDDVFVAHKGRRSPLSAILKVGTQDQVPGLPVFTDVLFKKEKDGSIEAKFYQVRVSEDYLEKKREELGDGLSVKQYVEDEDFSGDVLLFDMHHQFLKGRRYENGKLKNELLPENGSDGAVQLKSAPTEFKEKGVIDGGQLPGVTVYPPDDSGMDDGDWSFPSDDGWINGGLTGDDNSGDNWDYGGGGGGSSSSSSSSAAITEEMLEDFEFILDPGDPIEDIEDYIICFDDGKIAKAYKLTLYVDQPVADKNDQYRIIPPETEHGIAGKVIKLEGGVLDPGHTFVSFEKINTDGTLVRQTFGFYPAEIPGAAPVKAKIVDDGGHSYDVGYGVDVSQEQFFNALNQVQLDFKNQKMYLLHNLGSDEYNCSDAALTWLKAGGVSIADVPRGLFKNSPGDLGQALRSKSGAVTVPDNAGESSGPCN